MAIPDLKVFDKASLEQKSQILANRLSFFAELEDMGDETTDKMVRILRDAIIAKQTSMREMFDIKSTQIDIQIQPYFVKRRCKDICGSDATFVEIEWFVRKLISLTE